MRDGWLLTARLLLRAEGIAGLLATTGGVLLVVAALTGWFDLRSEVELLGHGAEETIATWRPLPGDPAGWLLATLGVVGILAGSRLALDRPVPRTLPLLAGITGAATLAGLVIAVRQPTAPGIAPTRAHELATLAEQLPTGVEHTLRATMGPGPAVAAFAILLLAAGAAGARNA